MLTYKYEAKNSKTGATVKAQVQANNEQEAAKLIKGQGLTPVSIKAERSTKLNFFSRIRTKDKVLFSRQLSTMINAGLPIVQSLRSVAEQTNNKPFKNIINQIITDVEAGSAFNIALAKYPRVFNRVYISLVAAGETSGTLDKGLERLADQQEKDADIVSKVRGAMIYPLIVLCVMIAVVIFMVVKVLPQVQNIYASLPGANLPIFTKVLLGLSHFIINYWMYVIIVLVVGAFFLRRWSRTDNGRSVIGELKMKVWPIGPLYMKMYMARFSRTSSTLVASGVQIIPVLEISSEAVDNVHISKSINKAVEKIKGGKSVAESLRNDPNFLPLVPEMIQIGEESGALEEMLAKIADYYEKEVDNAIKSISTIIEPVMMIIMGVIAMTIVAAILLPIYGLVNQSGFSSI
ncbi:MAG TPA: type II secretion system F family protein [Candidatus Sulfotelmatobacter sp.]|nr:type II secretion system F family protein [Candidatus Sulfotelmatobacter sp.]